MRELHDKQKEKIRNDLERYGGEILHSDEMERAYRQTHHTRSTVGEHTQRVAEKSLAIRDEKYETNQDCYRQHPSDSVEVARRLMASLPEKTPDIIERHMWPSARSKRPNSLEGVVVSLADKAAAAEDFIRGSRVKPVGFRETIRNIRKQNSHGGK